VRWISTTHALLRCVVCRLAHKGLASRLRAGEALRATLVAAKDTVRRAINRKIDEFVDLSEPEWCAHSQRERERERRRDEGRDMYTQ
jgi:hypothetical protein